ncbi:lytic polysaccharide monooxygenase [Cylindrobasidium torrendii FP15055 ss-10]|uniref:AA9 family lytic polysaccharide monooxygenase n=1 Tax=Cylindrobasidium torrendii FP15055 ss-10 TaxID=1314674 RepID=A0A0D7AVI0_9AGAR|nr:lytic polysaccharide monooxygenase [Cylindrobasidium torrendii FP15055 ss-10]
MFSTLLVVFATASLALAHGGVSGYDIGGKNYTGFAPFNSPDGQSTIERPYSSYDPILDATDPTIHCNNDGSAGAGQQTAEVEAGSTITAYWNQWTHEEGPVMVYMASCGSSSCDSVNSAEASWFKIAETGLVSGTIGDGVWGNTDVVKTLKYDAVIPAALADGDYLIRHELLALHQSNNPQFYPECAQLTVTGGGGATPEGSYLVKFPGGYAMSDPGVTIDIDSEEAMTNSNYTIPGPPVWTGA